jgi:hypothetical protein
LNCEIYVGYIQSFYATTTTTTTITKTEDLRFASSTKSASMINILFAICGGSYKTGNLIEN